MPAVIYECEYCGSRYPGELRVCERCGAARFRRIAAPPAPPAPPARPAAPAPERAKGADTAAVIVLAFAGIIAFGGLMGRINPENFCSDSPHAAKDEQRPVGNLVYTVGSVDARSGPGTQHPVLRRLPPGTELRTTAGGVGWMYATTGGGDSLGYIPATPLSSAPPTLAALRALPRKDREALERDLLGRMEVSRDSAVVRYRAAGAPDWRLMERRLRGPAAAPLDSARHASFLREPFAVYGEVEEEGDSVRLVLVAGEHTERQDFWQQVHFLPEAVPPDSPWATYRHPYGTANGLTWTNERRPTRVRFVAVPSDSAARATAWRVATMDSVQMRITGGACNRAHVVTGAEKERLRAVLRLFDVKTAVSRRDTEARRP